MLGWLALLAGGAALMGGAIKEGSERRSDAIKSDLIDQYIERWTDPELEERLRKEIADPKNEKAIWERIEAYKESKGYWTVIEKEDWAKVGVEPRPFLFSRLKDYPDGKTKTEQYNIKGNRAYVLWLLMQTYNKLPYESAKYHAMFHVYPINKK